jgi:hypothetical protein
MNSTDNKDEVAQASARIIGEVIRASGTKTLLAEVVKDLISPWTVKGGIRARIAVSANWIVSKLLRPGKNGKGKGISADVGRLLTVWAKKVNADHAADTTCTIGTRGDAIHSFLKNTDFGEIREMIEGSDPYVLKTLEAFNEHLWKYPAKVGTLVATIIPLINTLIRSFREILVPIEKAVGPDLLADIMLSIVKGINGADTAKLINSACEVIRRVHTGSLLLGKGGKPLFQIYLTDLLHDCMAEMDPELAKKIRIVFAQDREAIATAMSEVLTSNPEITLSYLASLGSVKTSDIKAQSRKLGVIEEIDHDGLKVALSESMSDLDTYEIAGLVNTVCRVANRIHDAKPDIVSNTLSGVVDSVDSEEMKKAFQWLVPDVVAAIKPLATTVMPLFINSLRDLISPDEGYASPEHKQAMESLSTALAAKAAGGEKWK